MVLESSLRMMILTGYVVHMEKMRTAYRISPRKAVGERPPGDFGVRGYHVYVYNLHVPAFNLYRAALKSKCSC